MHPFHSMRTLKNCIALVEKFIIIRLSAGFIKERVDQGVFFYKKNTKCIIYKIEVSEKQYDQFTKNIAQFKCF